MLNAESANGEGDHVTRRECFRHLVLRHSSFDIRHGHTFFRYSPVSVFTRTMSPVLTNGGTCTTRPVSSVAGFTCALAVAPLIPGTVSCTFRSTVGGSSMPTGSAP